MIQELVNRVTDMIKRNLVTKRDFEWFSDLLWKRTRERVSPTTLRRVWGYSQEGVTPRRYTLDVLARFLLFTDYGDFCNNASNEGLQSGLCLGSQIVSETLFIGQCLRMSWLPDRLCVLRYLGDDRFEIIRAYNTQLSVGDQFTCHLFLHQEPVYLDNLIHPGQGPFRYVAGKSTGVIVEKESQVQVG